MHLAEIHCEVGLLHAVLDSDFVAQFEGVYGRFQPGFPQRGEFFRVGFAGITCAEQTAQRWPLLVLRGFDWLQILLECLFRVDQ